MAAPVLHLAITQTLVVDREHTAAVVAYLLLLLPLLFTLLVLLLFTLLLPHLRSLLLQLAFQLALTPVPTFSPTAAHDDGPSLTPVPAPALFLVLEIKSL